MHSSNKALSLGKLAVAARSSPLSKAQVQEILLALQAYHPQVDFIIHYQDTYGDKDLKTSLRDLDKTDFFTREIDEMVMTGQCRLGIHSAKDLPHPLLPGLKLICVTKGLDAADVLVLRDYIQLEDLPKGAMIATSSLRREEMVKKLRTDLCFCDLRGTIEQRLAKLKTGEADGIVVAEAALIRLGLTHLNRIRLPGPTIEGQGQLAVVAKEVDLEMENLFACLDCRRFA